MRFNEKLFGNLRATTQAFMKEGPLKATQAIQQALRDAGLHSPSQMPQNNRGAEERTMHDINPPPDQKASGQKNSGTANRNQTNTFVDDLLNTFGVDQTSGQIKPDFRHFFTQYTTETSTGSSEHAGAGHSDANQGKFLSASYSNQAGTRTYKLFVPSSYVGEPLPLIIMLHGCTQSPDDFSSGTRMNLIGEEHACFVAYPEQTQAANSSKCWNWFEASHQQRDQGEPSIIAGITCKIMDEYAIKSTEVYIAGLSAGGAMAAIMGAIYPDIYAAVGVHSGLPFAVANDLPSALALMRNGQPNRHNRTGRKNGHNARLSAIPIIVFHGDSDTTVHPQNGQLLVAQHADGMLNKKRMAKEQNPAISSAVETGKMPHGRTYTRTSYADSGAHVVAEHWLVHGASHAWSGGSNAGSYTDATGPDASKEMFRFFSTQSNAVAKTDG